MSRYIALIHRGETGSWGISFPDFPGCISAADRSSFPDIVDRGAEALRFHVAGLRESRHGHSGAAHDQGSARRSRLRRRLRRRHRHPGAAAAARPASTIYTIDSTLFSLNPFVTSRW